MIELALISVIMILQVMMMTTVKETFHLLLNSYKYWLLNMLSELIFKSQMYIIACHTDVISRHNFFIKSLNCYLQGINLFINNCRI